MSGAILLAGATSGSTTIQATDAVTATITLPSATGTLLTSGTAVTVAQGGTGLSTLTANNVILGNGTSAPTFVAPSTSGNILTSNGTTWVSSTPAGGGVTSLNGQTGAITDTTLYAIGSYIIGRPQNTTLYATNSTIAGSSLYATQPITGRNSTNTAWQGPTGSVGASAALINVGTWRSMNATGTDAYANISTCALWVRIS